MTTRAPQISTYYLPVTQKVAEGFLVHGAVPDQLIERVGLFAVMMAGQAGDMSRANLSHALTDLYEKFLNTSGDVIETCLGELRDEIAQQVPADTLRTLLDRGIQFASDEQMASRAWCGANGRYTESFQSYCRDTLVDYELVIDTTDENEDFEAEDEGDGDGETITRHVRQRLMLRGPKDQARAARAIVAASDEHFTMTAYAGTGKTHLLLALAGGGGAYTHLAPTEAHSQAFTRRVGTSVKIRSVTLFKLATDMAKTFVRNRSTRWVNPPRVGSTTWSISRQVEAVGLPAIPGESITVTLSKVHRIINKWCFSADREITVEHVRKVISIGQLGDVFAYIAWAQRVWGLMSASLPAKEEQAFDFRLYHLVKWLDVSGAEIPPMGMLFLDEAHDLPAPWYSLLRRYPQGWVAMGDPYQCLSGSVPKDSQSKALTMVQSVRTGDQAMPLFRSVLDQHSERLVDGAIVGSRDHVTRPCAYAPHHELPATGLRVYGSVWKMLEEALRLKDGNARFRLVQASEKSLIEAARDAILLRRSGDRPKSYELRKFEHWDELSHEIENQGYRNVVRLFDRGFREDNLDELIRGQSDGGQSSLVLGLLEHCKNLEFSVVAMSSCCFTPSANVRAREARDKHIKTVYVAMTRVHDELWFPGDALDRLSD